MKGLLYSFSLLLFGYAPLYGQTPSMQWGVPNQAPPKTFIRKVIGHDSEHLYILRERPESFLEAEAFFVEKYTRSEYRFVHSFPVQLPLVSGKEAIFENIILLNNELILFVSWFEKSTNRNIAMAQKMDMSGMKLSEVITLDEMSFATNRKRGVFDFVLSYDSTKILIYHNEPFDRESREKFFYRVTDLSFREIWSNAVELPYRDEEFSVSEYVIDRSDNVYMLGRIEDKSLAWIPGRPNFRYVVLGYSPVTNEITEFEVALKQKSISSVHLRLDMSGNPIVGGLYSNLARSADEAAGYFFIRIDSRTGKLSARESRDIDAALMKEMLSERQVEKKEEMENFVLNHLVPRSDGGVFMLAEQYYVRTSCIPDPRTGLMTCTNDYYFNDIIVISVSPSGSTEWTSTVPKRQHSSNDYGPYCSYAFGMKDDVLSLFFNEHRKNLGLNEGDRIRYMSNASKAVLVKATADTQGKFTRAIAGYPKEKDVVARPQLSFHPEGFSPVIMYTEKGRRFRFVRIAI